MKRKHPIRVENWTSGFDQAVRSTCPACWGVMHHSEAVQGLEVECQQCARRFEPNTLYRQRIIPVFDETLQVEGGIFGQGPVQGLGTIGGFAFYFRARHQAWTLMISLDGQMPEVLLGGTADGHFKNASGEGFAWNGTVNDASHLSSADAQRLILLVAAHFRAWMESPA